jgi:single-stranded-DNA-specific exonuclease
MHAENVPAFIEKFEEVVGSTITDEQLIQQVSIEAQIELADIDSKFFRILSQFAPFGPENMSPVFLSKNVYVSGNAGLVGGNHVKMFIMQPGSAAFSCIAFNQAELLPQLKQGVPFDVCYTIEENVWREQRSIQLNIKAIRFVNGE